MHKQKSWTDFFICLCPLGINKIKKIWEMHIVGGYMWPPGTQIWMKVIEGLYRGVPRRWRRRGRWVLEPLLIICVPLPSTLIPLTLPTLSKPTSTSSTNSPGRLELTLSYINISLVQTDEPIRPKFFVVTHNLRILLFCL